MSLCPQDGTCTTLGLPWWWEFLPLIVGALIFVGILAVLLYKMREAEKK